MVKTYTCEKCLKVFQKKCHYTDHQKKKNDCAVSTAVPLVVEKVAEVAAKKALKQKSSEQSYTTSNTSQIFENLHNLLWNRAGLTPETAMRHLVFFFAYRMMETQADKLNLPSECRWTYLTKIKDEEELRQTIKAGTIKFIKDFQLGKFFKQIEIENNEVIYEIVREISHIDDKTLHESDTLGDIFEYMIGRGMSTMSDEGQYFTNRKICKLAFKLAYNVKKSLRRDDGSLCTFADWFCGTGGFVTEYVKGVKENLKDVNWEKDYRQIYCQDMGQSYVSTTMLNLLIATGKIFDDKNVRQGNSFADPITIGATAWAKDVSIDYGFYNPPYGGDKSQEKKKFAFVYAKEVKGDDGKKVKRYYVNDEIRTIGIEDDTKVSAGVQLAMATLSADGGICSIVLPQGFFFGASKMAIELRKKIAEEYKIHFVVDIPSGDFKNTGTKTSMLVFQKGVGSTQIVKFVDMEEKLLVEATLEDMQKKNYSLNYKQYLAQEAVEVEGFEMVKLGEVCQLISGYAFKSDSFTTNTADMRVLKIKNIKNECVVFDDSDDRYVYCDKLEKFIVKENEFVVAMTGATTGKVGIHTSTEKVLLNQRVGKFYNFKNTVLPQYVFYYIKNKPNLFMDLAAGTARENISPEQILSVQIPLPSLERQQQIVEAIDGWTVLAQQEEQALKTLEKQVMFQVKEMGRGKERVKLGDVCDFKRGKMITKKDLVEGQYPVIGGGLSPMGYHNDSNREAYITLISQSGENAGHVSRYTKPVWASDCFSVMSSQMTDDFLYYSMLQIQDDINFLKTGTAQPHIYPSSIESLMISVPPLTEQHTLQTDFDEIRHKHAKITIYKAKAHDAIQRLIPGASA